MPSILLILPWFLWAAAIMNIPTNLLYFHRRQPGHTVVAKTN